MKKYYSISTLLFRVILAGLYPLCHPFHVSAQQAVYVAPGTRVFSHNADTVSLFGDMINAGDFGTSRGAVVNFLGDQWQNMPGSALSGEEGYGSHGGLFCFIGSKMQLLASGYRANSGSGPSFPNLTIGNTGGVQLTDLNDLHIRGNLNFTIGNLYLNGWNTIVDSTITGYSKDGFIVTGKSIGGGQLYLESADKNNTYVFPIGTDNDSYTPLAVRVPFVLRHRIAARVFDHVLKHVYSGPLLDSDRVKKTWQLTAIQGVPQTVLFLQHPEEDEGNRFRFLRDSSYISLYSPARDLWDVDSSAHSLHHPGNLTTQPVDYTYLNDRTFTGGIPLETPDSLSWFSIASTYSNIACPAANFKLWAAQRQNYRWVQLFWRTLRETNVVSYELQRKRDTGTVFKTITTVRSKGHDGFSNHLLYYYYADDNTYDGWTSYRLKMTSASGCVVYTDIQTVPWGIGVEVWPNPSPGPTNVRITGIKHNILLQVINTWGQVLQQHTLNNDGIIRLDYLPDAVYFIVVRDPKKNNQKITTVKLVVQHTQ